MGMFDYIKFEMNCPLCKTPFDSFQSKDGSCELQNLELTEVENFYGLCPKCELWIDFSVIKKPESNQYYIIPVYIDLQAVNADLLKEWTKPEWRKEEDKKFEERWKKEKMENDSSNSMSKSK